MSKSKKDKFVEFLNNEINWESVEDKEVVEYWRIFTNQNRGEEKPIITENGKLIIDLMKNSQYKSVWISREIGEALSISSRVISGAMKKLVTDGFVEKIESKPISYVITDSGKELIY